MRVHSGLTAPLASQGIRGLALGFFDGVHLGHQSVFRAATATGQPLAILTFWPHPQAVLRPQDRPTLITGLEHKLHLFAQAGAQDVIVHPFDSAFAQVSADAFVDQLFETLPGLEVLACGPNFRFGHDRTGTPDLLRQACTARGILAGTPPLTLAGDQPISSSRIRTVLAAGDLPAAANMLGRPYQIRGRVVRGRALGAQLGFPTANVATDDGWLLPPGVYVGRARLESGTSHPAAINLGTQPTIDPGAAPSLEAHLIGFSGDLLGQVISIEPVRWLRGQQRFPDAHALREAIARDVAQAAALSSDG